MSTVEILRAFLIPVCLNSMNYLTFADVSCVKESGTQQKKLINVGCHSTYHVLDL